MDVDFTAIQLVPCGAEMAFAILHLQWNIRFARDARTQRGKAMGGDNHVLTLRSRAPEGWRFAGWSEAPDAPLSYIARLYRKNVRPGSLAAVDAEGTA